MNGRSRVRSRSFSVQNSTYPERRPVELDALTLPSKVPSNSSLLYLPVHRRIIVVTVVTLLLLYLHNHNITISSFVIHFLLPNGTRWSSEDRHFAFFNYKRLMQNVAQWLNYADLNLLLVFLIGYWSYRRAKMCRPNREGLLNLNLQHLKSNGLVNSVVGANIAVEPVRNTKGDEKLMTACYPCLSDRLSVCFPRASVNDCHCCVCVN